MTQPISVVIPVYDGVTQLDFTGPHQFLSRTPDLSVRVASLGGEAVTADRLTFSNLEDLTVIKSCDVLLVPGGGGCINAIENDRFIKEIARLGATARYLTSVCTGSLILGAAVRVPTKPAMHSNLKPAGYSDRKPATLGVNRMGRFDDVVEG